MSLPVSFRSLFISFLPWSLLYTVVISATGEEKKKSDMEISLEQMAFTVNVAANGLLPDLSCFNSLKEGGDRALLFSRPKGQGRRFIWIINSKV